MTMPLFSLMATDSLSKYDFTFYKTVSQSLNIVNKEKFGFDYTGFGFIGQSKKGVFLRFGIQTPYISITSLVKPIETQQEIEEDGKTKLTITKEKISDISISFILGSAKRYIFDNVLDFYLGYGFMFAYKRYSNNNLNNSIILKLSDFDLSLDFDVGAKFLIVKNHSLRIGIYGSYELFSYSSANIEFKNIDDIEPIFYYEANLELFGDDNGRIPIKFFGYISMGTTFTNKQYKKTYIYQITEKGTFKSEV